MKALDLLLVSALAYLAGLLTAALVRRLRYRCRHSWTCALPPGHPGPCQGRHG